jgi:hypothetical protein
MNRKKKLFIKVALVMSLLAINAVAATPGSPCSIRARVLGIVYANISGRVDASGNACTPNILLPAVLAGLRTGVFCGTTQVIGLITASSNCPN